jgi:hypothetical protein
VDLKTYRSFIIAVTNYDVRQHCYVQYAIRIFRPLAVVFVSNSDLRENHVDARDRY